MTHCLHTFCTTFRCAAFFKDWLFICFSFPLIIFYNNKNVQGKTMYSNVYGNKRANNAGEWISVDNNTGEAMIFVDSDTVGGFGFLKLTPL